MARGKKTVVEKIVDAVDKVIHPPVESIVSPEDLKESAENMNPLRAKTEKQKAEKSSVDNSDYASHPKFAKFKSIQGAE